MIGDHVGLAVDANQVWDVGTAIDWVRELASFDLAWVEEPTSPDDILGLATIRRAVSPVPIATGEHVANRVVFKQLLQAGAIDIMQIDACRVAGVDEKPRQPPPRRQVRGAGLPARRRRRVVRDRAPLGDVRLRRRVGIPRRAPDRVDRPSARALRRPGRRRRRSLPRAVGGGSLDGDARRVDRRATHFPPARSGGRRAEQEGRGDGGRRTGRTAGDRHRRRLGHRARHGAPARGERNGGGRAGPRRAAGGGRARLRALRRRRRRERARRCRRGARVSRRPRHPRQQRRHRRSGHRRGEHRRRVAPGLRGERARHRARHACRAARAPGFGARRHRQHVLDRRDGRARPPPRSTAPRRARSSRSPVPWRPTTSPRRSA